MKKYLPFLLIIVLGIIFFAGCAQNPSPQRSIQLRGNQSKGYTWEYETEQDDIISEVDRAFRDGNVPGTTDAPGLFIFTFEGTTPGQTKVYFHYVDPDDTDGEPLSTVVYDVEVNSAGEITQCEPIGTFLDVEGVERLEEILEKRLP